MIDAVENEVVSTRGAVATGHPAASRAAMRVLSSGGNVPDAAIAASAALAVSMPHATSIGGDAFILVRIAETGKIYGLNASGVSPRSATALRFHEGMQQRGALAPVVPGLARGWEALHGRFGCAAWKSLFDDAVTLAEDGCTVTAALASSIGPARDRLSLDPGCAATFLPFGVSLAAGDILVQPGLGRTLRSIAEAGAQALYDGEVGAKMIRCIKRAGGLMSVEDLRDFSASWVEPLSTLYRGHEIVVMPPNSYGILMLMQLQALAGTPDDALEGSTASRMRWQIGAMRACFDAGLDAIGDPLAMTTSVDELLSERVLAQVRGQMHAAHSAPKPAEPGGTSCVTVADAHGNAVCIVQSIYNPFGAHFLDADTGIILNNRMSGFDHVPGRVNSIAPAKRSAHTLNPVMATKDGRLRWVYASPGGISQTITGTQILVNLVDRRLSPVAAVQEGRWAVDRGGNILIEPSVVPEVLSELNDAGIEARRETDTYPFGSATLLQSDSDGTIRGAADTRRESCALGL